MTTHASQTATAMPAAATTSSGAADQPSRAPDGSFWTDQDGVEWYRIQDYDLLDPFLINVVTSDDQWIYVSSSGPLTAGRQSAEHALFPYETDDRLHRSGGVSGPLTIIRTTDSSSDAGSPVTTWQPFSAATPHGEVRRCLAKSVIGNRLRFEEYNPTLGLTFAYTWAAAGRFGLVRQCSLTLDADAAPLEVELLDGLLDVLPAGVELHTQQTSSTLVDAYRRSELGHDGSLALFTLEALISDRADPAEALSASVVWTTGLEGPTITLSDRHVRDFRSGRGLDPEHLVTGRKGAFLLITEAAVTPTEPLQWLIGADVNQDHSALADLRQRLNAAPDLQRAVEAAIDDASVELTTIVAEADGVQLTADRYATAHHFANTLFNCMRGGALLNDHRIDLDNLTRSATARNRIAGGRLAPVIAELGSTADIETLRTAVESDPDLSRLVSEYLPLSFSRRHGDPSRPWNSFRIQPHVAGTDPSEGYEGNWRDIFQNWDALMHSFPGFIPSVISKFLNASTMDGHNPYRITDRGIDWEEPEDGSWGNFGYWGDHQIVYLYRLLMAAERFRPGWLAETLETQSFSYGDVPYRLLPYEDLVQDPKRTIEFDETRQAAIETRVGSIGSDGRLVPATDGAGGDSQASQVHHVALIEKLLVPALTKLSNLVAGAGIWLNTQRPEWNDANNALVGNGVSTVTLFHLRDYLGLIDNLLVDGPDDLPVSEPVLQWMTELEAAFSTHRPEIPVDEHGDSERRQLLDRLGSAYSSYRTTVYEEGLGSTVPVSAAAIRGLLALAAPHLDHAAAAAATSGGLFHAYWLLNLEPGVAGLTPLYEMLEGQVAALGAADQDSTSAIQLLDALANSELYRPDQRSFTLYPNRPPVRFIDKNRIPEERITDALASVIDAETGIIRRSVDGSIRFAPNLVSGRHLDAALDELERNSDLQPLVVANREAISELYEDVFHHRAFTGRSHTMYRYEGLGSIYWHMVSKLLFALQDRVVSAIDAGENESVVLDLAGRYQKVRSGLGFMKTAAEQGSFPTDPHSHTPAGTGAQQPGMTGQVKEGVLIRWGELGVYVRSGVLRFSPTLLDPAEFLGRETHWNVLGPAGTLSADTLGFTYCGVPVVYQLVDDVPWTRVTWADGRSQPGEGAALDQETSAALFSRTGLIHRIDVGVPRDALRLGHQLQ